MEENGNLLRRGLDLEPATDFAEESLDTYDDMSDSEPANEFVSGDSSLVPDDYTPNSSSDDPILSRAAARATSVTITYNGSGHSSGTVPASHVVTTPGSVVLKQPGTLARTGYTFGGWRSSNSGNVYKAGQSVSISGSGTIRYDAVWNPTILTITYNGNGNNSGYAPASQSVYTPGSLVMSQPGSLSRTGYIFDGWQSSTSGKIFKAGTSVSFTGTGSIRYDAVWKPSIITITYNGNGNTSGSTPAGQTLTTPSSFVMAQPGTLARPGYVFGGWKSSSSGNIFKAGQSVNLTGTGTIRYDAVWNPAVITVAYTSTGHTSGSVPTSHTVNTPGSAVMKSPGALTRSGYVFGGWKSSSSGKIFKANQTVNFTGSGTIRYDAVWTANSRVVITYDGNGHTSGDVPYGHNISVPGSIKMNPPGTMAKVGYKFAGWKSSTSGNIFSAGQTVKITGSGSIRYSAVWVPDTTQQEQWYTFSYRDANGRTVQVYLNGTTDSSVSLPQGTTRAVVRYSNDIFGTVLNLVGNYWQNAGSISFTNDGGSLGRTDDPDSRFVVSPLINIGQILAAKSIQIEIDNVINSVERQFYISFGFYPNMLTKQDRDMLILGVIHAIDENLFLGLAKWVTGSSNYDDNYFYLVAKQITTSLFIAHFGAIAGVSAANAVSALGQAGAAGAFALATLPTGIGAVGGGAVAVAKLTEAAVSAGVSIVAVAMMDRSVNNLGETTGKLNSLPPRTAGRGSTGRTNPMNLNEQLAMESVKSNPLSEATRVPLEMTDPRWPSEQGWVKMQRVFRFSDGTSTTIHFVYSDILGLVDDFKFVFPL
jgi:hypothetical protein